MSASHVSGLALGLTSAIGLMLPFRIASGHQQTIIYRAGARTPGKRLNC